MKKIFSQIYLIFVYYIPIAVIIAAGVYVVIRIFGSPLAFEKGKLFFGFDVVSATLAGLSFYASYTSSDDHRKTNYYACAEDFFHALVLFIFIRFLQDIIIHIKAYVLNMPIQKLMVFILGISVVACFVFAFKHFVKGIFKLMHVFHSVSNKV